MSTKLLLLHFAGVADKAAQQHPVMEAGQFAEVNAVDPGPPMGGAVQAGEVVAPALNRQRVGKDTQEFPMFLIPSYTYTYTF